MSVVPPLSIVQARLLTLATALIALLCLCTALGDIPLTRVQEVRVAETAIEMQARHDWLVPTFNGELRLQKPPLAYWLAMTGYAAGNTINEWTLRIPTVLVSAAGLALLFGWLRRAVDVRTAAFAVLCLVSTAIPLKMMRVAETDPLLMTALIAAACLVYRLIQAEGADRRNALLLYVAMGLGALAKGPPAIAIPLALFLVTSWRQQWSRLRALWSPAGIALCVLLAGGWYWLMYQQHGHELIQTILKEGDDTYLRGDHKQPVYYYLLRGPGYYAPWSLLLIPAAFWYWRQRNALPLVVRMAAYWFAIVFVMLSFNANKQAHYSLLLAPSFAILIGYYLAQLSLTQLSLTQLSLNQRSARMVNVLTAVVAIAALACLGYSAQLLHKLHDHRLLPALAIATVCATGLWLMRTVARRDALILTTMGLIGLTISLDTLHREAGGKNLLTARELGLQTRSAGYQPLYFRDALIDDILFYARGPIPVLNNARAIETRAIEQAATQHSPLYLFERNDSAALPATLNTRTLLTGKDFRLLEVSVPATAAPLEKPLP